MARINRNYEKLPGSYLFSEIARRTAAYQEANPDARLIKMGIGDVTRPLAPAVVAAMHAAVDDLAAAETFHGYGHGAVPAARRLWREGVRAFAVASLSEGIFLRKHGVRGTILILGYTPPREVPLSLIHI